MHMNEIAGETNINVDELSEILLKLELKKLVKRLEKLFLLYLINF